MSVTMVTEQKIVFVNNIENIKKVKKALDT